MSKLSKNYNRTKGEAHETFDPQGGFPHFGNTRISGQVVRIVGTGTEGSVVTSNPVAASLYGKYFTVGMLDNFSSLSTVFDQYRITKIEAWFVPSVSVSNDGTKVLPDFYTANDIDDGDAPSSVSALYQYSSCIASRALTGHYHCWVPHVALAAYGASGFTSTGDSEMRWLDCASSSIQHYGIKAALTNGSFPLAYDMIYRIHVEFRAVH